MFIFVSFRSYLKIQRNSETLFLSILSHYYNVNTSSGLFGDEVFLFWKFILEHTQTTVAQILLEKIGPVHSFHFAKSSVKILENENSGTDPHFPIISGQHGTGYVRGWTFKIKKLHPQNIRIMDHTRKKSDRYGFTVHSKQPCSVR